MARVPSLRPLNALSGATSGTFGCIARHFRISFDRPPASTATSTSSACAAPRQHCYFKPELPPTMPHTVNSAAISGFGSVLLPSVAVVSTAATNSSSRSFGCLRRSSLNCFPLFRM